MSLAYSDTTNKDGVLQRIEQELGFADGYITGDSTRLKFWTGSVNLALDHAFHLIFGADGRWQFDDQNHTDYPIITTNIVATQRDYAFTTDSNSNLILDIHKVLYRKSTTDPYYELIPVDAQSGSDAQVSQLTDGLDNQAHPSKYDKTANGIFLGTVPPDSITNGLKIYINREGSYFTTSDTTKTAGFAGLYHQILVLEPCYRYARIKRMPSAEQFKRDLKELEANMIEYYGRRDRHERKVLSARITRYK